MRLTHLCWPVECPGQQSCAPAQQTVTCPHTNGGTKQHCTRQTPMLTLSPAFQVAVWQPAHCGHNLKRPIYFIHLRAAACPISTLVCMKRPVARCSAQGTTSRTSSLGKSSSKMLNREACCHQHHSQTGSSSKMPIPSMLRPPPLQESSSIECRASAAHLLHRKRRAAPLLAVPLAADIVLEGAHLHILHGEDH